MEESLEKNRISNISTVCRERQPKARMLTLRLQAHSNIGYLFVLVLDLRWDRHNDPAIVAHLDAASYYRS